MKGESGHDGNADRGAGLPEALKSSLTEQQKAEAVPFADLFHSALENAAAADAAVKRDELLLASGQVDDLHTITMDLARADLALQTVVQVRNKVIDAYNEIMKVPL
jgi:flagellar hook-basal body complex protein FliE